MERLRYNWSVILEFSLKTGGFCKYLLNWENLIIGIVS